MRIYCASQLSTHSLTVGNGSRGGIWLLLEGAYMHNPDLHFCRVFNDNYASIGAALRQWGSRLGSPIDEILLRQNGRITIGPAVEMRNILNGPPGSWWQKLDEAGYILPDRPRASTGTTFAN